MAENLKCIHLCSIKSTLKEGSKLFPYRNFSFQKAFTVREANLFLSVVSKMQKIFMCNFLNWNKVLRIVKGQLAGGLLISVITWIKYVLTLVCYNWQWQSYSCRMTHCASATWELYEGCLVNFDWRAMHMTWKEKIVQTHENAYKKAKVSQHYNSLSLSFLQAISANI